MPEDRYGGMERVVCHELTHNLLAPLDLPRWLNEGMAIFAEHKIAGSVMDWDSEQMEKHRRYWNAETIQGYWSGHTFNQPGEEFLLSYQLAAVMGREIFTTYPNRAGEFVNHVRADDYGAEAAIEYLQTPLGAIASMCLGPGSWEPVKATSKSYPPAASSEQLVLAFELIRGGRIADAQEIWEAVLKDTPEERNKLAILDDLASIGFNHDLPEFLVTANQLCREGLAIAPTYLPLQTTHGALLVREEKYLAAKEHFLTLLSKAGEDPDKATIYYFLALAAHHLGEAENAREFLGKAIELAPSLTLRAEAELAIEGIEEFTDEPAFN